MNGPVSKLARCAIYTRKSTEYNLELAFNSLDAQRQACEAYIKSQAHEGWRLIPGRYDDGAFSGASLDRPALQQLLAEVRAGKIDIVLVYKVDRLTRSLADFAKLTLLESEPFSSKASFVFQLHPDAQRRLRDAWRHEDLRSLDLDDPLNAPAIVLLKGLTTFESARLLTQRCLNDPQVRAPGRQNGIAPFDEAALKRIWEVTEHRPRYFLRALHQVLQLANESLPSTIDESFVTPLLKSLTTFALEEDGGDVVAVDDERLA